MNKFLFNLAVTANEKLGDDYSLLHLTSEQTLPEMAPGQFVEVRVEGSPTTFLRRPISINFVDRQRNELWLLVRIVGAGTRRISQYGIGEKLDVMLPLGNKFSMPQNNETDLLLVGGGVGMAPMLFLGKTLHDMGMNPVFLLGGRSAKDILQFYEFEKYGEVCVTTEDGTLGEKGFVTNHSILNKKHFGRIYACGPKPMMAAVAKYALKSNVECEVSLENMMACGLGVCLCCVEKTIRGNVCVCKEGPVFNIKELTWQI